MHAPYVEDKKGKGFPAHGVVGATELIGLYCQDPPEVLNDEGMGTDRCECVGWLTRQEAGELARAGPGCPLNVILRIMNLILILMGEP